MSSCRLQEEVLQTFRPVQSPPQKQERGGGSDHTLKKGEGQKRSSGRKGWPGQVDTIIHIPILIDNLFLI